VSSRRLHRARRPRRWLYFTNRPFLSHASQQPHTRIAPKLGRDLFSFLMIAITFPIHDRSHTAKRRCEPFISPSRRQTPFDHDRRPDSELASVRGQTVALPDSTCTPATRPRQTIATSLCRRYQARCHHWHRADPRVGSDAGISWIDPPAYSSLDAYTYRDGVHPDLPAEVLAAALEHGTIPATAIATNRSRRSRKRRETGS
jgi:hypothetical protein